MKRYALLFAALLISAACLNSCSKDDDTPAGEDLTLPKTVTFADLTIPEGASSFKAGGMTLYAASQEASTGGKTCFEPNSTIYTDKDGNIQIASTDFHTLIVDISALPAPTKFKMRVFPEVKVVACDGNTIVADAPTYTTPVSGSVIKECELDLSGKNAKRIYISTYEATVYSISVE